MVTDPIPDAQHQAALLALGQNPPLQKLYEDRCLLVVNKPAGQLFHGHTRGLPQSLVEQVKADLKERSGKTGQVYLGVVHRIDRPVSGISLFARNSKFAGRLSEQFQSHTVDKYYLAWVEGRPLAMQAELEDVLPMAGPQEGAVHEKVCSLSYQVVHLGEQRSLLRIKLGTGRRHQIRRQLSLRGWPIVGDLEHGASAPLIAGQAGDPRFQPILLHAESLHFAHPLTFERLRIEAPLPFYWPAP